MSKIDIDAVLPLETRRQAEAVLLRLHDAGCECEVHPNNHQWPRPCLSETDLLTEIPFAESVAGLTEAARAAIGVCFPLSWSSIANGTHGGTR